MLQNRNAVSAEICPQEFPYAERRARISAEAKGQLRLLWEQLAADASQVRRAVEAIPQPMARAAATARVGASAALDRMAQRLPVPLMSRGPRRGIWRFLEPTGERPPSIRVMAVLLGATGRPVLTIERFALEVTYHALGRLIDQDGKADLKEAVLEAHDCLAILPATEGEKVFGLSNMTLPARSGAFLISPPSRDWGGGPMLIAKTWVHSSQFSPRQAQDFVAWGKLISALVQT